MEKVLKEGIYILFLCIGYPLFLVACIVLLPVAILCRILSWALDPEEEPKV